MSVLSDPALTAPEAKANRTDVIYGVDTGEQDAANAASGDARKYAPTHEGWVGITTYMDMHGNLRVKSETIVALNIASGDQSDDTIFPDS